MECECGYFDLNSQFQQSKPQIMKLSLRTIELHSYSAFIYSIILLTSYFNFHFRLIIFTANNYYLMGCSHIVREPRTAQQKKKSVRQSSAFIPIESNIPFNPKKLAYTAEPSRQVKATSQGQISVKPAEQIILKSPNKFDNHPKYNENYAAPMFDPYSSRKILPPP